jgi:putative FmdB family regulatory protein
MPIYEFRCKKCGDKYELKLGFFHNKKEEQCPKCGGQETERVFSAISSQSSGSNSCGSQSRSFG